MASKKYFDLYFPKNIYGSPMCHIACTGITGAGKTTTIERIATVLFERGFKIIDLYSAGKMEGAFYSLPSNNTFWDIPKQGKYGRIIGKKAYPTKLLFPVSFKYTPTNLPSIAQLFTIPVNDLVLSDIQSLLGLDMKVNEKNIWNIIESQLSKSSTPIDVLNMIDEIPSQDSIKHKSGMRFLSPTKHGQSNLQLTLSNFVMDGTLSSGNCPTVLDLKNELRENNITTLILSHYKSENRMFIIHYFLRKIYDLLRNHDVRRNVVVIIREAYDLLPKYSYEVESHAVKKKIEEILMRGRSEGLFFIIDSQSISQLTQLKSQFDISIAHRTDDFLDIDQVLSEKTNRYVSVEDKQAIGNLGTGEAIIFMPWGVRRGYIVPPRCAHRNVGEDFFDSWRKNGGNFININDKLDSLKNKLKEDIKEYNIKFQKKIEKMKKKKEKKEEKIEEKKEKEIEQRVEKEVNITKKAGAPKKVVTGKETPSMDIEESKGMEELCRMI